MTGFSGRKPSQRDDELKAFIELLSNEEVRSYLEIGARDGDTFHEIMSSLTPGARGVAVDLPGGPWGREDSRGKLVAAVQDLQQRGYDARAVFGDAQSEAVRSTVARLGPFHAALIDGDHRIEAVTADWQCYGGMARIVAFHDVDGHGIKTSNGFEVEVPALWGALKQRYRHREIIGRQRGMGIGVLWH